MKKQYTIVFTYIKESEKAFFVKKSTKKIDKTFWIPKSVVKEYFIYEQEKSLPEDIKYKRKRISLTIESWFVKKELKFTS